MNVAPRERPFVASRRHGQGQSRGEQACRQHDCAGRAGLPDDIGPMIASLVSEDNRWINAQRIEVPGGMSI
jgi:NAD(P)-dependent dehydrogenase (short-subunit alcohol dehydrogenase family)